MGIVRLLGFGAAETGGRAKGESPPRPATVAAPAPVEADVAQIEADTRLATRWVRGEAEAASATFRVARKTVESLRAAAESLALHSASSGDIAASQASAASPGSVLEGLASARDAARGCLIAAADAETRHGSLGDAIEGVAKFVPVFATIARESQIVALNTALASARSGSDARRFEGMAEEIERLASRTRRVAEELSERVQALRVAGAESRAATDSVVESVAPIDAALAEVAVAAVEVTKRSREAADRAGGVAEEARKLERAAHDAVRAVSRAGRAGDGAVQAFGQFAKRASVNLRTSQRWNRRRFERAPVRIPGAVFLAGARNEACALDVSEGGALLAISGCKPRARDRLRLCLGPAGDCPATVVAVSDIGHHVAFENPPPTMLHAIRRIVADAATHDDDLLVTVQMAAAQASRAFEEALTLGDVAWDDLFSTHYRRIEDLYPARWETRATPFCERVLRPILSRPLKSHPILEFGIAIDRNAYVPVEVGPSRDRPDIAPLDMGKRIADIDALAAASRNTAPIFVYLLPRRADEGLISPLKVFSAPIWVADDFWGTIQIGRKL